MKFFYSRLSHCELYNSLLDCVKLRKTICYMLTYKVFSDLKVKANKNSIQIYNRDICVYIILYVGFENEEFLKNDFQNIHYVSLDTVSLSMHEFEKIDIKFLNKQAIFYTAISMFRINDLESLKYFIF